MHLHDIITNDYVQFAVIVSGLLTLGLLSFQLWRAVFVPLYRKFKIGWGESIKRDRAALARRVSRSLAHSIYFQAELAQLGLRVALSIVTIIAASFSSITCYFLFIPGFKETGGQFLTLGIENPKPLLIVSTVALYVSMALFINSVRRMILFIAVVKRAMAKLSVAHK